MTLTDEGLQALPPSARRCVTDGELRLDQWSLAALDAPMYPQWRFQIGVVEWLRQRCGDETLVEVIVQHSRGGGKIERLTAEQFDERRREFWINQTISHARHVYHFGHVVNADNVRSVQDARGNRCGGPPNALF